MIDSVNRCTVYTVRRTHSTGVPAQGVQKGPARAFGRSLVICGGPSGGGGRGSHRPDKTEKKQKKRKERKEKNIIMVRFAGFLSGEYSTVVVSLVFLWSFW